ncbi:MAG: BBE domain-containing protein [Parachlamydiaceae bacterium]|nr:BBE domain-containing protein [Parachlamydiaceae bacterium]
MVKKAVLKSGFLKITLSGVFYETGYKISASSDLLCHCTASLSCGFSVVSRLHLDKKRKEELNSLREKLTPCTIGNYVGNPDLGHKNFMQEYYGGNADRLRCIKRKYDPHNVFHFEQSILPAPLLWRCL